MARINIPVKKKRVYRRGDVNYYNCSAWKKMRAAKLMEQPLCEECLAHGRVNIAVEVHHIKRILSAKGYDARMGLLLDYNNLRSLCICCHKAYHRKMVNSGSDSCCSLSKREYDIAHGLDY